MDSEFLNERRHGFALLGLIRDEHAGGRIYGLSSLFPHRCEVVLDNQR